jgi:hypothetical protein
LGHRVRPKRYLEIPRAHDPDPGVFLIKNNGSFAAERYDDVSPAEQH